MNDHTNKVAVLRLILAGVLLAAATRLSAGDVDLVGNMNVATNLTVGSITLGGVTNSHWPYLGSLSNDVGYMKSGDSITNLVNNGGYLTSGSGTNAGNLNLGGNLSIASNFTVNGSAVFGGQSRTNWPNGTITLRLYGRSGLIPVGSTALPVAPLGNYIQFSATTDRLTYEVSMPPQFSPGAAVNLVYRLVSCDALNASGTQTITILTPAQVTNWPPTSANFDSAANSQSITFSTSGVISQQLNVTITNSAVFNSVSAGGVVAVQIKPSSVRNHWFGMLEINQAQ